MPYKLGIYGPLTEEALATYRKLGIDAVFTSLGGDTESGKAVKRAKEWGLKVYACTWTFKAPQKNEALGIENLRGEKMLWDGTGCPNNRVVSENNLAWVRAVSEDLEVDGITLDGVRFSSPGSGLAAFLSCFCPYCEEKAEDLEYDLPSIRETLKTSSFQDLSALMKSYLGSLTASSRVKELRRWTNFRRQCINEHIVNVKKTVEGLNPKMEVGAATFTPSLAPLVGQNYKDLGQILDFLQPMVYHRGEGIACINHELAKFMEDSFSEEESRARALKDLYDLLGWEDLNPPLNLQELKKDGLPLTVIKRETERAKKLMGKDGAKLTPIIFIHNSSPKELKDLIKQAQKLKTEGLVYYAYYENLKEAT